ncbi:MAG TPA: hypothetical protein VMV12_06060 [Candidatus Micrarchaeaceae archaeon]|nr:hypothetical protein [Candidatus Micrarchaeaceae archaeon]
MGSSCRHPTAPTVGGAVGVLVPEGIDGEVHGLAIRDVRTLRIGASPQLPRSSTIQMTDLALPGEVNMTCSRSSPGRR